MFKDFKNILSKAKSGDTNAIEFILLSYMPLINKHSKINGYFDEDLKQFIILQILVGIKIFRFI